MTDANFNPIRPVRPVDPVSSGTQRIDAAKPRAPAFEALLERLEAQARQLEQQSRSVAGPADLADAVGRAQETLETALSFSDRVLEAFRQSVQQRGATPDAPRTAAPEPPSGASDTGDTAAR